MTVCQLQFHFLKEDLCIEIMKEHRPKALRVTTTSLVSSQKYPQESEIDSFGGGLQLLKLELELQNTWKLIDWGPGNKCFERMECESHCQDHWFSKPCSKWHPNESLKDEINYDTKNNLIKSLLRSNKTEVNITENGSRNQKLNRIPHKKCFHCSRNQNKINVVVNPLEQLIYGDIQKNWANITEAVKLLILFKNDRLVSNQTKQYFYEDSFQEKCHPYLSSRDEDENTPLLYACRRLLKERAFGKACTLCELFIQAGSDVNAVNVEGRTLLTYSVQYFDDSFELTRLLINSGATVWPLNNIDVISSSSTFFTKSGNQISNQIQSHSKPPSDVTNVVSLDKNKKEVLYFGPQNRDTSNYERNSAFTWFLRSIIRCRKLNSNVERTLGILCDVMGENPERMHSHVMRTMFRHAKCFKVLGPIFYQLKSSMMPYWRQPKDLKYLCRKEIRRILGPSHLRTAVNELILPKKVVNYILLE